MLVLWYYGVTSQKTRATGADTPMTLHHVQSKLEMAAHVLYLAGSGLPRVCFFYWLLEKGERAYPDAIETSIKVSDCKPKSQAAWLSYSIDGDKK